ncbi:MAG: stage V sporulation protein AD [Clostridia bacterium]|nr:stage V sporulation protein AD [Clostridia bacterium]
MKKGEDMAMSVKTDNVYIMSFAAAVGKKEGEGPLKNRFDYIDKDDRFGMKTWEMAESECSRLALSLALAKIPLAPSDVDFLIAGDLENQCVASTYGLLSFELPYIGIYGACSNLTEGLSLASMLISGKKARRIAVATSSHNCAAERQFRGPIEYGGQRTPTAQWTVTGAGGYVLGEKGRVKISDCLIGTVQDKGIRDLSDMGAAMAPAAADTLIRYFRETGTAHSDYDLIITGDLGNHGSELFKYLCEQNGYYIGNHTDCGKLIYSENQDAHSGGSGCGCIASVFGAHFLPHLEDGRLKNVLLMATGALMNKDAVTQGQNIPSVAHIVHIEYAGGENE